MKSQWGATFAARYLVKGTSIQHPVSSIQYPASSIQHHDFRTIRNSSSTPTAASTT
ncbi:MAG: hypothetical protein IPN76_14750 [Saprospiraceae bacterium]|nr:hypothetical protein [Saprospiraceae bacterium]